MIRSIVFVLILGMLSGKAFANGVDGNCQATTTSCTLAARAPFSTATVSGDLLLGFGYISGSRTPPTPPSGWTTVTTWSTTAGGTTGAWALACKQSTGATGSGTWSGVSDISVLSITATKDATTCTNAIGTPSTNFAKSSTSITFNGLTLTGTNSWVVGFSGVSTAGCTPSSLSLIASAGAGPDGNSYSTNGTVSSFSSSSCTISSGTWGSVTVEVLAGNPTFVQVGAAGVSAASATCTPSTAFTKGDDIVVTVGVSYTPTSGVTVSNVTDPSSDVFTFDDANTSTGTHPQHTEIWHFHGLTASQSSITVNLSASTEAEVHCLQFTSVSGIGGHASLCGPSGVCSTGNTSPSISLTTQDANNLIVGAFSVFAAPTASSPTGTLLKFSGLGDSSLGLYSLDNTSASPASVSVGFSIGATAREWSSAALELRSVASAATVCANYIALMGAGCN